MGGGWECMCCIGDLEVEVIRGVGVHLKTDTQVLSSYGDCVVGRVKGTLWVPFSLVLDGHGNMHTHVYGTQVYKCIYQRKCQLVFVRLHIDVQITEHHS